MSRLALVSSGTLRTVLRLLERSGLASVRPHIVNIRIELLRREAEAEALPVCGWPGGVA